MKNLSQNVFSSNKFLKQNQLEFAEEDGKLFFAFGR